MYSRGKISLGKPVPMSTMFCGIMPLKDSVSLYFLQGAKLPDPDGLLAGTGKGMRHVKIRDWKQIRPTANKKLVRAAYQFIASSWQARRRATCFAELSRLFNSEGPLASQRD